MTAPRTGFGVARGGSPNLDIVASDCATSEEASDRARRLTTETGEPHRVIRFDFEPTRPRKPVEPAILVAVEPAILVAEVEHEGRCFSLTLVRVHYRDEGTAILEEVRAYDAKAEGLVTQFIDFGTWRLTTDDGGPTALSTECNMPEDLENPAILADRLMSELVRIGGSWGLDAFEGAS